jgi:hypothetical protein
MKINISLDEVKRIAAEGDYDIVYVRNCCRISRHLFRFCEAL